MGSRSVGLVRDVQNAGRRPDLLPILLDPARPRYSCATAARAPAIVQPLGRRTPAWPFQANYKPPQPVYLPAVTLRECR